MESGSTVRVVKGDVIYSEYYVTSYVYQVTPTYLPIVLNKIDCSDHSSPQRSAVGQKTTTMRYYEQRYPEVDELVMVQVRQIAEMGAYVKLVSLMFSVNVQTADGCTLRTARI